MNRLFLLILCLACFASYFNSLNNDFVFDDKALIIYNPIVKSLKFLPLAFKKDIYGYFRVGEDKSSDVMYRPMQLATYWADYKIWGLNPLGFRLTNILLHLLNSILVYYLLLRLFDNKKISGIASILFAVHPIHTSVVSYIAGRADLLSCFFMLLSALSFLSFIKLQNEAPRALARSFVERNTERPRSIPALKGAVHFAIAQCPSAKCPERSEGFWPRMYKRAYLGLSLLWAAFALISRESALILFIFIALILFVQKAKPRNYFFISYFILLDLFYLLLRFLVFGQAGVSAHPAILSFPLRLVNFFNIIPRYIWLLFAPSGLHLLRVTPFIKGLPDAKTFFTLLFILLYILLIIRFRKVKLIIFSLLWFLIGIIPAFFYLDGYPKLFGAMMAESWIYLSSIGFLAVLAHVLSSIKRLGRVIIISFIVFYCVLTIANNVYWRNDLILHRRILEYNPAANSIRRDLIDDYLFYGRSPDALAEIKKYSLYEPDSPDLDIIWGNYYFASDKLDSAISNYNKALSRNRHFFVLYRLSACYKRKGQLNEAIESGLESLKINPGFLLNLIQLGDLYKQKRQLGLARKYYRMSYELNPHNKALRGLIENAE